MPVTGSGLGSWTKNQVHDLLKNILPDMFNLAAAGKLVVDTITIALEDVESIWNMDIPEGKRLVVLI